MPSIKYKKKTYAGATFPVLEMTKAQYDALPEAKKMDGTVYMITDDTGGWEAENASYDNTESGLTATNVQDALDEIVADGTHPVDVTGFIVANTGFTLSNVVAVHHKSILQINFVLTRNADTGANETINIGTLTASFRPKVNSGVVSATYSGIVGADGRFYLRPFQRVPANQGESVCVIMLI